MDWSNKVACCGREGPGPKPCEMVFVMKTLRWPVVADEVCCVGYGGVRHPGTEVDSTANLVACSPNNLQRQMGTLFTKALLQHLKLYGNDLPSSVSQ